jgi:transcriptional regulator with XRE-family HTH domain
MRTTSERDYIRICKREIEKALALDNANSSLKTRNFEYLSQVIAEKSGITISLSTLKRLWREDFSQIPQPATLNALAAVLGYKDWQEFKQKYQKNSGTVRKPLRISKNTSIAFIFLFIITAFILFIIFKKDKAEEPIIHGDIRFTANKTLSSGVPNTVVFTYDVSNVVADSFFIQQSWNYMHREPIDPGKTAISSIYYTPGFHRAKLIANNTVIAQQNVHILSDGWIPYVKYSVYDRLPIYFNRDSAISDGRFNLDIKDLKNANIDMTKEFVVRLVNSRDFGVTDDNFSLNTLFKCDSILPRSCPKMDIMLGFEKNVFWVELVNKGCEHFASYLLGEVYADGKSADLTGLGCNIYNWQDLSITVKDRHAEVILNGNNVIDVSYKQEFGKLASIYYTFNGLGSVDYIRLAGADGQIVFEDNFD